MTEADMSGVVLPSKYRRLVELGRGGMAAVHLTALSGPAGFQKLVVVKEMRPDLAQQDEFRGMFFEEARVAAQLNHPNVVQTYEVIEDPPGVYCIVMEFLDGQPLSKVITRARHPDMLAHVLFIVAQALGALHYLHELKDFNGTPLGLVHRDVSPHNLFVTYDGDVKLVDFGIAKTTTSSIQTEVGTLKGKVAYMSPEQAMGREIDRATDIFAAGVVLWEALTRKRIWEKLNNVSIIGRLCAGDIPPIRGAMPDVPPALEAICMRALSPNPDARYATAFHMQREILDFAATLPVRSNREMLGQLLSMQFADDRRLLRKAVDDVLTGNMRSGERFAAPQSIPSTGLPTIVSTVEGVAGSGSGSSSVVGTTTDRHASLANPVPPRGSALPVALGIAGGSLVAIGLVTALVLLRTGSSTGHGVTTPPSSSVASSATSPPLVASAPPTHAPPVTSVPIRDDGKGDASAVAPVDSAKDPGKKVPGGKPGTGRPTTPAKPGTPEDPNDVGF